MPSGTAGTHRYPLLRVLVPRYPLRGGYRVPPGHGRYRHVASAIETRHNGHALDALYPHVTLTGRSLACSRCGAQEQAPQPRDVAAYNAACTKFVAAHKACVAGGRP